MRPISYLCVMLAVPLAACGGDAADDATGSEAVSFEEAAERARSSDVRPRPGLYRSTVEVLEVSLPGAPANMAEMMRSSMGGQAHEYCLTEADVERGFEEMARQSQEQNDCEFERFDVDGVDIDARLRCDFGGQGAMTMTMSGTGGETSSEMNMTMQGNMGGMGDATIRMKAVHERVGDCG